MRNIEWWMKRRHFPQEYKQRMHNYERQRWVAMCGVDECDMIRNLPEGPRRDIKYHLCLDLVKQVGAETDLESATPGLLIRKRKLVQRSYVSEAEGSESISTSVGTEIKVEDAMALLLKHKKGYHALEDESTPDKAPLKQRNPLKKDGENPKRILGPERPSFLDSEGNHNDS